MTVPSSPDYPDRLDVDYQQQHNRVTTLFRVFLVVAIGIVIAILNSGAARTVYDRSGAVVAATSGSIAGGLLLATLLMILFRQRYRAGGSISP